MSGPLSEEQTRNMAQFDRMIELNESGGPQAVIDRFDEFFHADFEWSPAVAEFGGRVYRGKPGWERWLEDMSEISETTIGSFSEVRPTGEHGMLALGRVRMHGKESGLDIDSEYAILAEMRDGRGIRGWAFLSHQEAEREAVRLLAEPGGAEEDSG